MLPAVDIQYLTGDKGAVDKKHHGVGDVLGRAVGAERDGGF